MLVREMPSYMQRLRNLREDHDMTQKQIAQILGTSQTMYARYERGGSELPIRHLITLCRYYQVSALKNLEKTSFALPLIVSQGNFSADRAKCGIKQKAENHDLKKLNKLPLADASCINHSALRSSSPKLRKPYGWASMSTSIC